MQKLSTYTIKVKNEIIQEYKNMLHFNLQYWESHNDPESRYHLGISKQDKISDAKQKIEEAKYYGITLKEVKESGYYSHCIRAAMRNLYKTAIDFNDNPYIKINYLKQVVLLRKIYNKKNPNHVHFTTRYLTNLIKY